MNQNLKVFQVLQFHKSYQMFEQHFQGEQQEFVIPPHQKYEFKLTTSQKIKAQTLIIALYGPASLFAQSLVSSKSPDARVNFLKAKQTSLADLYITQKPSIAYLIFNGEVQKMKEVYFSEFISQNFEFSKVIILTHEYINNLQRKSSVCLQHLKTSVWTDKVNCNQYQEGLMGLGADILVWAEILHIPACCYIGLFQDYQLSRESVKQVFGSLNGKQGINQVSDIGDKIKKYNMKKYSNNLYL